MKIRLTPVFKISLLVFVLLSKAAAQGYVEILPDDVKKPFQERYENISRALNAPVADEWAGNYYRDLGSTWGDVMVWEPKLGFAAYRDTCSNGPRAWVNYGSVSHTEGMLTISPERGKSAEFVLDFPDKEFTPVRWGKQHWLVPTTKLALFASQINSRSGEEYSTGYLKSGDGDKVRSGIPDLPPQYRKILSRPPIRASIVEVRKGGDLLDVTMVINRGSADGVIDEMSFWLIGQKGIDVEVNVIEALPRTSTVRIIMIGSSDATDKEISPTVGWRFTNRMPAEAIRPG
jgi:hypothetical protein